MNNELTLTVQQGFPEFITYANNRNKLYRL